MQQVIFDSDRHVMEPLDLWPQYVDPAVFKRYPVTFRVDDEHMMQQRVEQYGQDAAVPLPPTYLIGDLPILAHWGVDLQIASAYKAPGSKKERQAAMSGEGQLASMDEDNIAKAAIFSTFAGLLVNHQQVPTDVSLAYADGYNRWLKDYCAAAPDRMFAVGLMSRHNPDTMVEQLEKIISYGWRSVTLRPEVILGHSLASEAYEPFWQKCAENGIGIAFHGGTHLHAPTAGTDRYTSRFGLHACSHPMEAQMAFVSLLESGVLERHPTLKFAFLEAGASWIPHWLWRLDNICYPEFRRLTEQNIKMLPSEYFKRQCWVGVEIEEPCLRQVVECIGPEKLIFGSDFPHPDHLDFDLSNIAATCQDLTEEEVKLMLYSNAEAFFNAD